MKLSDRWFSSSSHISDGWEYDDYFYDVVCHYHDDYDGGHSGYGGRWDLSFCQFQGFGFWFQHQGDGEEDEEEEGSSEDHHNVGVPEHDVDRYDNDVDEHKRYLSQ